jgi:hypothetical protein
MVVRVDPASLPADAEAQGATAHSLHQLIGGLIRPVQKSPSLTVAESWLSTVVSSVSPTVPGTISVQAQRKLCSGPNQVRRLALSLADLCCRCGVQDAESAAEKVRSRPNAPPACGPGCACGDRRCAMVCAPIWLASEQACLSIQIVVT